ncbi:hypothetical protein LDG_7165 [Legionella drancourtii LLAP12]|uniref:Uncharacterized protein n=1 Tax=Legionella drancourtii LLAP12 TaxID=658187 RepID=G9EPI1_9GAMM|nr:hypothetical protein LDG_7165 [Legionella drancourtii LLAP12]
MVRRVLSNEIWEQLLVTIKFKGCYCCNSYYFALIRGNLDSRIGDELIIS